ncbi:hypothetical protein Droror1_Dr00014719 [Drosera rotundifolia]
MYLVEKKNIITHSMGGILVKCFLSLHPDIFEKYVKNWIAIAAPFQGAPGYITSTFFNGMSFVEGWEQNFFISKWNMHQLADGFNAEARIGVPGEHHGILRERHVFRILEHWLNAGEPDPYYDPVNDFVILPTSWETEKYIEKCIQIALEKDGWEIASLDLNKGDNEMENKESVLKSLSASMVADSEPFQEQAHATLVY